MALFTAIVGLVGALATLGALYYAWQTVRVARDERLAGQHDRRLRELREIGGLVERIFWDAKADPYVPKFNRPDGRYRIAEQNVLAQALAGSGLTLPECWRLVEAETSFRAYEIASTARQEIRRAIDAEDQAGCAVPQGDHTSSRRLAWMRAAAGVFRRRAAHPTAPRTEAGRALAGHDGH